MGKVILVVLVGSVVGWFGVLRFIEMTSHMPETFSITQESYDATVAAKKRKREATKQAEVDKQIAEKINSHANSSSHVSSEAVRSGGVVGEDVVSQAPETQTTNQVPASVQAEAQRRKDAPKRPVRDQGLRVTSAEVQGSTSESAPLEPLNTVRPYTTEGSGDAPTQDTITVQSVSNNGSSEQRVAARGDSDIDTQERGGTPQTDNNAVTRATLPKPNDLALLSNSNETLKKEPETVEAMNVAYALPTETTCVPMSSYPQVGVLYRPSSYAIKGKSLNNIDQLVKLHRECEGGKFIVLPRQTNEEADERLAQLRQDEVKYYLLQRRIPKGDIIFSDKQ